MNNSNESDKLSNILLTNSILEHNNKNNKQKNKIISAEYYTRNKTMIECLFYFRPKPRGKKERKVDILE